LILFPINEKKIRAGESSLEECKLATQLKGPVLPIKNEQPAVVEFREVTKDEKKFKAFATLRKVSFLVSWSVGSSLYLFAAKLYLQARTDARLVGIRAKRAKEAAESEDAAKGDPKKAKK